MGIREYISRRWGRQKVRLVPGAKIIIEPGDNKGTKVRVEYEGKDIKPDDEVVLAKIIQDNTSDRDRQANLSDNTSDGYVQNDRSDNLDKESLANEDVDGCCGCVTLIGAVVAAAVLIGALSQLGGCNRVEPKPTVPETTIVQEVEVDVRYEGYVSCMYTPDGFTSDYGYFKDIDGTLYYPENPTQLEGIYNKNKSNFFQYQYLTDKTFGERITDSQEATLSDIAKLSQQRFRDDPESWRCTIDVSESLRNTFAEQNRIENVARNEAEHIVLEEDKFDLGLAHINSIDRQKGKTNANIELAGKMDEWGNILEQAMQDKKDGSNYIDDVSSKITNVYMDRITGNVDIEIEGVVRSSFTCTGETQEEVWQQIQAFYEEYQPYTDGEMGMTTTIQRITNDGNEEERKYIFGEGRIDGNIKDLIKRTIESYSREFLEEIEVPESTQTVATPNISEEEVIRTVQRTHGNLLEKVKGWFGNFIKPKSTQEPDIEK